MLARRIEDASLNAWPALQQVLYDGWILRFSRGYTKRANSVNALFSSSLDVNEKIVVCEQRYAERGLPPVFRMTPFASPPDLDLALERRDYEQIDVTLVQHLDLGTLDLPPAPPVDLRDESLDDWIAIFCELRGAAVEQHATHKTILQNIPFLQFLASLVDDAGQVVACGVGVLEDRFVGLFDLITAPSQRNQGYGTRLVSGVLAWARAHGAQHAYLQVEQTNTPARHVYEDKFGFRELYRYWYRRPGS